MNHQSIEDADGFAWVENKLQALNDQIRESEKFTESLKAQREPFLQILKSRHKVKSDSEPKSKSERIIEIVIDLINKNQRPVASSEILAAIEERGIVLGSVVTKKTSALSAILNYELTKRKQGSRLKSVERGMFDIK